MTNAGHRLISVQRNLFLDVIDKMPTQKLRQLCVTNRNEDTNGLAIITEKCTADNLSSNS